MVAVGVGQDTLVGFGHTLIGSGLDCEWSGTRNKCSAKRMREKKLAILLCFEVCCACRYLKIWENWDFSDVCLDVYDWRC